METAKVKIKRALITLAFLFTSAVFLYYNLSKEMRKNGIATITIKLLMLNSPQFPLFNSAIDDVGSKIKNRISNAISLATKIPPNIESIVSRFATRVSELASETTGLLNAITIGGPLKITLGTDQICQLNNYNRPCRNFPSSLSELFPMPFPILQKINLFWAILGAIRAFIAISLAGILILNIIFIVPFLFGFIILRTMPILRILIEIIVFFLIAVPLVIAAMAVIAVPFLFETLGILEVTKGNLGWCLGIALVITILSNISFIFSRTI